MMKNKNNRDLCSASQLVIKILKHFRKLLGAFVFDQERVGPGLREEIDSTQRNSEAERRKA